ncbi:hypothetical protein BJX70DRAFT_249979 [Aspergillus crustosus]
MSNLPNIHEYIFKGNAKRIIIKMKTTSVDSEKCRADAYRAISDAFLGWESDSRVLFLAIQVWGDRIFIDIDINRDDYNYETAHKDKTVHPVYVLRKHRGKWVLIRWPREDERLATELAELHRVTGYGAKMPFLENHNTQVVYANPHEFRVQGLTCQILVPASLQSACAQHFGCDSREEEAFRPKQKNIHHTWHWKRFLYTKTGIGSIED